MMKIIQIIKTKINITIITTLIKAMKKDMILQKNQQIITNMTTNTHLFTEIINPEKIMF